MCFIVLHNTLHKTIDFLIAKIKIILLLAESISKKKTPYINALDRKNLAGINKKILDKNKAKKISKVKLIIAKNKHTSSIQSRSRI